MRARIPARSGFGTCNRQAQKLFGQDHWPYGVDANRTTLEAFLQYAHDQGVCHRRLAPEDLFPEQVLSQVRV